MVSVELFGVSPSKATGRVNEADLKSAQSSLYPQESRALHADDLVARFASAVNSGEPMAAARAVLEELKDDLDGVAEALSYLTGTGGNCAQAFSRSPTLRTLVKIYCPLGRRCIHANGVARQSVAIVADNCATLAPSMAVEYSRVFSVLAPCWRGASAPSLLDTLFRPGPLVC
jgi:hypothetical protein